VTAPGRPADDPAGDPSRDLSGDAAVRATYDTIAADYDRGGWVRAPGRALDRALLAAFAAAVEPGRPVADLGCGPGHVTAHLAELGLAPSGLDLSPAMVARARRRYPDLAFAVGSMTALDAADASLGGISALYSTMHVPTGQLSVLLAEFRRALLPGGPLLLAVFEGDGHRDMREWLGHEVFVRFHYRPRATLVAALEAAGFVVDVELVVHPSPDDRRRHHLLLAHRDPVAPHPEGRSTATGSP
jgi:SAM-dependent methyltransferase